MIAIFSPFRYEQRNIFVIKVTFCTYFLCLWVWEHSIGLVRRVAPFARSQPTSSLMWRWWWGWCSAWSACWRSTWPSSTCSTPGSPRGGRPHTSSMRRRRWGSYSYQALFYYTSDEKKDIWILHAVFLITIIDIANTLNFKISPCSISTEIRKHICPRVSWFSGEESSWNVDYKQCFRWCCRSPGKMQV